MRYTYLEIDITGDLNTFGINFLYPYFAKTLPYTPGLLLQPCIQHALKKLNFYMSFSLTNHSRENFIYSWGLYIADISACREARRAKIHKEKKFLNSDLIPCS